MGWENGEWKTKSVIEESSIYGGSMWVKGNGDNSLLHKGVETEIKKTSMLFSRWVLGGENLILIMPI